MDAQLPHKPRVHTFFLRIWPEGGDSAHRVWRGSLDSVEQGERVYFQTLDGLLQVITQILEGAKHES